MTPTRQLELLSELWDHLEKSHPDRLKLTPEQEAELDRRLEEAEKDPEGGIPWEEVKNELGW